jgi:hypothetical protein
MLMSFVLGLIYRYNIITSRGLLGVPKFFPKSFPNDVESTILGRSGRQRKENENILRKKMLATSFGKHFGKNPLGCLALSLPVCYDTLCASMLGCLVCRYITVLPILAEKADN